MSESESFRPQPESEQLADGSLSAAAFKGQLYTDPNIDLAARLAKMARNYDKDEERTQYPPSIVDSVLDIRGAYVSLEATANLLHKDDSIGGKPEDEKKFAKLCERMVAICDEIFEGTTKSEEEKTAIVRELWNGLKKTPKAFADAVGHSMEEVAQPTFKGMENPILPLIGKLAEARDTIQKEYKFSIDREEKLSLGNMPYHMLAIGVVKAICLATSLPKSMVCAGSLVATASALVMTAIKKHATGEAMFVSSELVLAKGESFDHIRELQDLSANISSESESIRRA